ncbi:MAG TPA: spore coat protein YsxE [Bacillus bacterium]|nr:spore coat protein YsxE [Bacillus sp. (in: firmicutes)]
MGDHNFFKEVSEVLKHYPIDAYFAEDFGKVKKIYTKTGTFALKKIHPYEGTDFVRQIQFLYQKGYNRIIPVYPANDGRYAILHNKSLYYLMPWLANGFKEDQSERHKQLFRELARMHSLTAKELDISSEVKQEHFTQTIKEWEKEEEFLEGFIESCENRVYMSPFELTYCLYYSQIRQAIYFAKQKLENWHEKVKDQKKSRVVILHGKVSTEHFLLDERGYGYFINFENARQGSPIQDLLPFLARSLKTLPKRSDETVDWVYAYFKYFPFKEDEMQLFLSYLAFPAGMIRVAKTYHQRKADIDERKFVQKLQRQFWLLNNTAYVVTTIDELEKKKQQEKQAQQEGAQS